MSSSRSEPIDLKLSYEQLIERSGGNWLTRGVGSFLILVWKKAG